jgi:hypothetical protein
LFGFGVKLDNFMKNQKTNRSKKDNNAEANVPRQVSPAKKCSQPECQLAGAKGAEIKESPAGRGLAARARSHSYSFFRRAILRLLGIEDLLLGRYGETITLGDYAAGYRGKHQPLGKNMIRFSTTKNRAEKSIVSAIN